MAIFLRKNCWNHRLNSSLLACSSVAASLFNGSSGLGSRNRYCNPYTIELIVRTGFQSSRRIFRHTLPSETGERTIQGDHSILKPQYVKKSYRGQYLDGKFLLHIWPSEVHVDKKVRSWNWSWNGHSGRILHRARWSTGNWANHLDLKNVE